MNRVKIITVTLVITAIFLGFVLYQFRESLFLSAGTDDSGKPLDLGGKGLLVKKYPGNYASFQFITPSGVKIVSDPYNMNERAAPDIVTESHQDMDHRDTLKLDGEYKLFKEPGRYSVKGVKITGIPGKHNKGDKETTNTIFVFEFNGIKLAHFASQGEMPSESELSRIQGVDVLLIQGSTVAGYADEKLTADECYRIIDRLKAKVVIPEHGTPGIGDTFAKHYGTKCEHVESGEIVLRESDLESAGGPRILDLDNG